MSGRLERILTDDRGIKMKLSKRQLKRIIRNVIQESMDPATKRNLDNLELDLQALEQEAVDQQVYNRLYDHLDSFAKTNMSEEDLIYKLRQQVRIGRLGLEDADPATIEEVVVDWIITNKGEL